MPGGTQVAMPSGMDPSAARSRTEAIGSRILVRGRRWTVGEVTRAIDCAALRLNEIGGDCAQTLLTPFDRPRPLDGDPRPRVVGSRRWLHALDRALVRLHPFGTLHAAARAPIRLLPYQLEPALAVLRHGVTRLLVADGVGPGQDDSGGPPAARARASPRVQPRARDRARRSARAMARRAVRALRAARAPCRHGVAAIDVGGAAGARQPMVASGDLHHLARSRKAAGSPASDRGRHLGRGRHRRGARRHDGHRSAGGVARHRRAVAPRDAPDRNASWWRPRRARRALPDRWE